MKVDEDVISTAGAIASAAADPGQWEDICDRVAKHLGAVSFVVFSWNPAKATIPRFRGSSRILREAADLISALPDQPAPPPEAAIYDSLGRGPRECLRTGAELLGVTTNAELPANPFYDAMRARLPIQCRAGARLGDIGPMLDVAAGHFAFADENMPERVRADAAFLFPFIARAVEANRVIEGQAGRLALLSSAFDHFDFGVLLTDGEGGIHMANATARAMLADREGVSESRGRLETPSAPGALAAPIAAAFHGTLDGRGSLTLLPRGSGRPMLARVFAIKPQVSTEAKACLLLVDPDDPRRFDARGISALGLLTAAETDVVTLFLRGAGTEEIAERRNTTRETTRGQMKSATAKLGCATRVDLLRLAMATHVPLRREDGPHPPSGG